MLPHRSILSGKLAADDSPNFRTVADGVRLNDLGNLPSSVPLDSDGFASSFDAKEKKNIKDFFDKYGFVIIRDVLTPKECDATLEEFWQKATDQGLQRDDPKSWGQFWGNQRFGRFGIVGNSPDQLSTAQLSNRCSQRVYAAFSTILEDSQLWVDHDRLGVLSPNGSSTANQPSWRTIENWLHLDCNPVAHDAKSGYASIAGFEDDGSAIDFQKTLIIQGLLSLTDARVEDGGFHCVPGSHKISHEWATHHQSLPSTTRASMQVPRRPTTPMHTRNTHSSWLFACVG